MTAQPSSDGAALSILIDSQRKFLAFLEKRVGNRADAEEILQSAFAKAVQHEKLLEAESVVAWFFRVLRNGLVDYYRRKGIEERAIETIQKELSSSSADWPGLQETICECFRGLLPTLKEDYAEMLQAVDLGGQSVVDVAEKLGITANNAGVRLHRARLALKQRLEETCRTCAEHGCLDCSCKKC